MLSALRRPRVLLPGIVVVVMGAFAGAVALQGGDGGSRSTLIAGDDPAPGTTPSASEQTPVASAAPATQPDPVAAAAATSGASSAPEPVLPARCRGPLLPGERSDPSCDALHPHTGLPHPCIDAGHACAWPDAHGAVPAGPYNVRITLAGNDIHVSWTGDDIAGGDGWGPVHSFVIRLCTPDYETVLRTQVLPTSRLSTDLTDVAPGTYAVSVQELNDSGLSAGMGDTLTVKPPPTPAPSPTTAPKATPSPSPTPSGSRTPTPSTSPSPQA